MNIGIYGGSFNPPHYGHEKIIRRVIKDLKLDKLLIVPVGIPCHGKSDILNGEHRYEMCKIYFEKIDKVEISRIEIDKKKISYTYETLEEIINNYGKNHNYFEIIGGDSAEYFNKWREYKKILKLSKVVVIKREGYVNKIDSENIIEIENEYYKVSSSKIREKLRNKKKVKELLKKEIFDYILKHKLY